NPSGPATMLTAASTTPARSPMPMPRPGALTIRRGTASTPAATTTASGTARKRALRAAVSSSAGSKTAVMVLCSRTGRPRPTLRGRCRPARARKAEGPEGSIPEGGGSLRARPRKADGGALRARLRTTDGGGRRQKVQDKGPTTEGGGQRPRIDGGGQRAEDAGRRAEARLSPTGGPWSDRWGICTQELSCVHIRPFAAVECRNPTPTWLLGPRSRSSGLPERRRWGRRRGRRRGGHCSGLLSAL